jgi:protocatechuate 3,4-dioxygenase alpha subunit
LSEPTPFQTLGPFFAIAYPAPGRRQLATRSTPRTLIHIEGTVRDGAGRAVSDALIETWQADERGHYAASEQAPETTRDLGFTGFGRIPTDDAGRFSLETIVPGSVPSPDGKAQAPHLLVGILARGILGWLVTRMYFEGEPANAHDGVLALVPAARRSTLIARRAGEQSFQWDITLQGDGETVFFDV